ncbi:PTS sugar transporter subunit IIA [Enterococcus sp. AZ109]|uniref:PTS sugar transporter subunit IIA n=1 Tax=Enterococcus sp. AZ109 TaxID=2774634 RepID=UPI003F2313EA
MQAEIFVYLDIDVKNQEELFDYVSKKMVKDGYAKADYFAGLIQREQEYPTGLKTEALATAIPHTEMAFILKPFIAVVRLTNPIEFTHMMKGESVLAEVIFFLGISQAAQQLTTIQKVLSLITDKEAVQRIMSADDAAQIKSLMSVG